MTFALWLRPRPQSALRGLLVGVGVALAGMVLVGVVFLAAYRPLISARAGIGEESVEMRSISDRIVFTGFAERAISERPAFGVGIGSFPWRTAYYIRQTFYDLRGDHVHQIYLYAAAELGLPGLALFVAALGFGLVGGIWTQRRKDAKGEVPRGEFLVPSQDKSMQVGMAEARVWRAGLVAVGVAFAVIGFFDHYPYTILHMQVALWGCLAAAMAAGRQPG